MLNSINFALKAADIEVLAASILDNCHTKAAVFTEQEAKAFYSDLMAKSKKGHVAEIKAAIPDLDRYRTALMGSGTKFTDQGHIEFLVIFFNGIIDYCEEVA